MVLLPPRLLVSGSGLVVVVLLIHSGRWSRRGAAEHGEVHVNRAQDWDGVAEAHLSPAGRAREEGQSWHFKSSVVGRGPGPGTPAWNRVTASASLVIPYEYYSYSVGSWLLLLLGRGAELSGNVRWVRCPWAPHVRERRST